jgi:urease accessory protein
MHIIQRALSPASDLPSEKQVVLAVERRQFLKRRWRGVAEDGVEFGFDLDERLSDGCVVYRQAGRDYIVRQLTEAVYEIPIRNPGEAALMAWKIGNLHLPVQIAEDWIRALHDEAMARLLEREGWAYSEPEVLFTPMKAMAHTS